jgi:hypothetical protein
METNLRARTLSETRGFLKALVEVGSDRIPGFTAFGVGAGEILGAVQIAMRTTRFLSNRTHHMRLPRISARSDCDFFSKCTNTHGRLCAQRVKLHNAGTRQPERENTTLKHPQRSTGLHARFLRDASFFFKPIGGGVANLLDLKMMLVRNCTTLKI